MFALVPSSDEPAAPIVDEEVVAAANNPDVGFVLYGVLFSNAAANKNPIVQDIATVAAAWRSVKDPVSRVSVFNPSMRRF